MNQGGAGGSDNVPYEIDGYLTEIDAITQLFGLDKSKLSTLMNTNITPANINEYGRFDELKVTVDKQKAKAYFESVEGISIPPFKVNIRTANFLQKFIIEGGFELGFSECSSGADDASD